MKRVFMIPSVQLSLMSQVNSYHGKGTRNGTTPKSRKAQMERDAQKTYGTSDGQLGNDQGETFWSAAKQIVQQCFQILRPGGVAVWVCKDFVRDKKRVAFSDDWRHLCEACGFVTVEWIKASLVKEWQEATLFDGQQTRRTERKSFFRRLAEKKGSPRIDHEDVLVMVKPGDKREREKESTEAAAVVTSPPYSESNQDYADGFRWIDKSKMRGISSGSKMPLASYGKAPGQLSAMPTGNIDDCVTE